MTLAGYAFRPPRRSPWGLAPHGLDGDLVMLMDSRGERGAREDAYGDVAALLWGGQARVRRPHSGHLLRRQKSLGQLTPTATVVEHALLTQGFKGVSKVPFPRRF